MWEAGTPLWCGAQGLSRRCPPGRLPESTVSAPLISLREMISWIFLVSPAFGKSVTCLVRSWWCGEAQIPLGLIGRPGEPGGQQEGSSGLPGYGPPGRGQMLGVQVTVLSGEATTPSCGQEGDLTRDRLRACCCGWWDTRVEWAWG